MQATGDELERRGLKPSKPECHCWVYALITGLVCTIIFGVIWELT